MSLISLFSDKHGFLVTDQLVYSADELSRVNEVSELSSTLCAAIAKQKRVSEQAEKAGYAAGFDAGAAQAKAEQVEQYKKSLLELHVAHEREITKQRNACASLAVDIVRKIADKVAPEDWLYATASAAAVELIEKGDLVLRVHSSGYNEMLKQVKADNVFDRVVADESLDPQSCYIDTQYGSIDVNLETQLQQVLRLLDAGEVAKGSAE